VTTVSWDVMSSGLVRGNWTVRKIPLPPSEGHRTEQHYTQEDDSPPYEQTVLTPNIAVFN